MATYDTSKVTIDDALTIESKQTPSLDHNLFVFKLQGGVPVKGSQGYYSIQTLLSALGQDTLENRKLAERYALGTENGEPVSSGAGYQSNAKYFWELCQQLASSVDGPALSARIAVLEEALTLQEERGGMSPGFHWWLRETSALPERSVILDGSEILYSLPEANDILKFVGTRYGENEDQTGFFLPDLITTADNNALGNFIRATATDDLIGSKESDAIRNITGKHEATLDLEFISPINYTSTGAISTLVEMLPYMKGEVISSLDGTSVGFSFSANQGNTATNPIAGHAAGDDIHPYSIRLLPILIY